MQENVKKCKNFLATLIKLASHNSPSPETSRNVKALVQDLLVSPDPESHHPSLVGLKLPPIIVRVSSVLNTGWADKIIVMEMFRT